MKTKDKLTYRLVYGVVYALSLLPLRVLYVLADGLFLVVYHVVRYRRQLVRRQLTDSFPAYTAPQVVSIERRFYHFFCDYMVETLKLLTVRPETLLRHIEFRGTEQLEACFDRGQSCAALLGHYCNWEWLSASGLAFQRYPQAVMGLIYHPLYSKAFDRLFINIRSAQGGVCIPKKDILRYAVRYRQEGTPSLFGYISDQAPKWENIHLWVPFLNHDTPVFTGAERIIRKMKNAVFYVDMQRPRRGQYVCTFRLMTDRPQDLDEMELTRRFFLMLEQSVKADPTCYLWTHNRWKRTHQGYDERVADGRIKVNKK